MRRFGMGYFKLGLVLTLVLLCTGVSFGQTGAGSLIGRVTDVSGAVLPGITITATSEQMIGQRQVFSDESGNYRIIGLPPGSYSVTAELPGFSTYRREGIAVRAGANLTVNVEMQVGSLTETISVTADTPMVETTSTVSSVAIAGEFQRAVPVQSRRNWSDILEMQPGINTRPWNDQSGRQVYYGRGVHHYGHVIEMDGARATSYYDSQPAYLNMSTDTLGDVEVKTGGYDASLPMGNGIQLNIVTPSGGNQFHGKAAYALQPNKWNGDNTANTFKNNGGSPTKQDIGMIDASMGGPIVRDKIWFFGSFRDQRIENFISRTDFFIENAKALAPNQEDFQNKTNAQNWFIKITTQLNQNHNLLFSIANDRTSYQQNNQDILMPLRYNASGGYQYTAKLNSIWTSGLSTQIIGSWNDKSGASPSTFALLANTQPERRIYDSAAISGSNLSGDTLLGALDNTNRRRYQESSHLEFKGDLTYFMQGGGVSHEFKTGIFMAPRSQYRQTDVFSNNGFYSEHRVLLDPNNKSGGHIPFYRVYADPFDPVVVHANEKNYAFYVQDQWKPINALTLNMGVRVDFVKRNDVLYNFTRQDSTEIAPRLGFSLMLDRDAKNVIRGSAVRLHAGMTGRDGPTRFASTGATTIRSEYDNDLDGIFETTQLSTRSSDALIKQRFHPELSQPYIDEFILAYRRQFPGQLVLDIAGTMKHVEHNYAEVDINGIYPAGPGLPFLGFGKVDVNRGRVMQQTNNTYSRNNLWAGDFTVTKNMSNGFMLYGTLGVQKHYISGDWNPTDPARFISPEKFPDNKGLEDTRGNGSENSLTQGDGGSQDIWKHYTFSFMGQWDAPLGIKVSSGYTLNQGSFNGVVKNRLSKADPTYGPSRFTLPNGTTQSNPLATRYRMEFATRGEGQFKAPNVHNMNVKIGKEFQISDSQAVELSINLMNIANSNSFYQWESGANRLWSSRYQSGMRSLQPARAMQLFLKYSF